MNHLTLSFWFNMVKTFHLILTSILFILCYNVFTLSKWNISRFSKWNIIMFPNQHIYKISIPREIYNFWLFIQIWNKNIFDGSEFPIEWKSCFLISSIEKCRCGHFYIILQQLLMYTKSCDITPQWKTCSDIWDRIYPRPRCIPISAVTVNFKGTALDSEIPFDGNYTCIYLREKLGSKLLQWVHCHISIGGQFNLWWDANEFNEPNSTLVEDYKIAWIYVQLAFFPRVIKALQVTRGFKWNKRNTSQP